MRADHPTRSLRTALTLVAALGVMAAGGCSVGEGIGQVRGRITVPQCAINNQAYDMEPNFFGADWHAGSLIIHVARGGDTGEYNDELALRIDDTAYVAAHLGERIAVGPPGTARIQAVLRLSARCGRNGISGYSPNAALEAYEGYAVFRSVYRGAPTAEAAARFTDIAQFSLLLRDPRPLSDLRPDREPTSNDAREPPTLSATRGELEGGLQFYFARGRPAQRFQ